MEQMVDLHALTIILGVATNLYHLLVTIFGAILYDRGDHGRVLVIELLGR